MKKIIFTLMLLFSLNTFSQETEYKLSKDGFTDFIVTSISNKTQSDLYKKTIDWINITYKNPSSVILSKIENEYIRIEGSSFGLVTVNVLGKHPKESKYTIEISFKDGRYKFDVISISGYDSPSQYTSGGWFILDLSNTENIFNKKGELKGTYKYYSDIPLYFNQLNNSLYNFIISESIPSKEDKW